MKTDLIYHLYLNIDGTIDYVVPVYGGDANDSNNFGERWTPPVSNTSILFASFMDYDKLIIHAYKGDQ